jgi:hypothetical protein
MLNPPDFSDATHGFIDNSTGITAALAEGRATQKGERGVFFFWRAVSERIITFRKENTCLTP